MSKNKLSIITPTLNSGRYIQANLESIQKLNIPVEHIIVDGGSTDDTLNIVAKYPDVKIIHQTSKEGMYQAIDMGFNEATGTYITWVNSDDYIIPEAYEKMFYKSISEKADLCYSNGTHHYVNENRFKTITGKKFPKFLLRNKIMPFIQPCSMYTKEIFEKVQGLNYQDYKIAGDLDFFRKIANVKNAKFTRLNETTCIFLKHGESLGDKQDALGIKEKKGMLNQGNWLSKFIAKVIFKLS